VGTVDGAAAAGLALLRACRAGASESAAIWFAIVSALGEADRAAAAELVCTRGTSTNSAVSERGEQIGGEIDSTAEEDSDQTISSSSDSESLAHLVLEWRETTSSEDESEVVMALNGVGERIKNKEAIYLMMWRIGILKGHDLKGVVMMTITKRSSNTQSCSRTLRPQLARR